MDLSLIIACYNEETVLEHSLKEIIMTLDSTTFTYEIIFVDDYSTDNTPKLINFLCEKYKDKHQTNSFFPYRSTICYLDCVLFLGNIHQFSSLRRNQKTSITKV